MDLYDFANHADLGGPEGRGSSSWGWAKGGREFGIVGQFSGAAFVEITKKGKIVYLGRLPAQDPIGSRWREIRVLKDWVIIGSEAIDHNVQIFDLNKLLKVDPKKPVVFDTKKDLVGLFSDGLPIGRTHNIVIDWDNEYAIAVGAQPRNQTCAAGLQYIDLADPTKPSAPGCASQDGYVHDAQCVKYNGPDRKFRGRNICIGYNEDTVTIYDSTKKNGLPASEVISKLSYTGASYTHQGWWTESNWHQFILFNDELDEQNKAGPAASGRPVTHIADLSDLRNPKYTGNFFATDLKGIDHNLYIVDELAYQSNYGNGVWVHDVRSIKKDPTGAKVKTEGFFDIYPEDDATGGTVAFVGTWSHFLFPSGYVMVNTIERGVFVVKLAKGRGAGKGRGHGGKSTGGR
jgi:choice-of-anchor B domain-containing protein